ncbi:MAG: hypothetical protein U5N86_09815 [Planctomycetota bacterium]|nr:hypothetical protein [Planctomycetota bacterium]
MLLVFFDSFPKPSERFLHRDLEGLLERCAGVRLGALRRVYDEPPPFPVNSIYGNEASICDLLAGLFCPVFYACAFSALFRLGPCAFLFLLRRFGALRCIAKETPLPGRVHSMHGGWCGLAAWVLARRMRVPFSFSCHARDVFVQKRLLKFLLRRADHVITCNSKANAVVREAAPGACRSYFIPHPVSEPFRKRSSEGGYLLAAGLTGPQKGLSQPPAGFRDDTRATSVRRTQDSRCYGGAVGRSSAGSFAARLRLALRNG